MTIISSKGNQVRNPVQPEKKLSREELQALDYEIATKRQELLPKEYTAEASRKAAEEAAIKYAKVKQEEIDPVNILNKDNVLINKTKIPTNVWVHVGNAKENASNTINDFTKAAIAYVKEGQRIPSQEELKARYEADQKRPMWQKLIFGTEPIIYDKDKNEYIIYKHGEAPPAGKVNLKSTTTIPINYNKVLEEGRRQQQIAESFKSINQIIAATKSGQAVPEYTQLQQQAFNARVQNAYHFFEMYRDYYPQAKILNQAKNDNALGIIFAVDPSILLDAYNKATKKQKTEIDNNLDTATKNSVHDAIAVINSEVTTPEEIKKAYEKVKKDALADVKLKSRMQELAETGIKEGYSNKNQGATDEEIEESISNAIDTQVQQKGWATTKTGTGTITGNQIQQLKKQVTNTVTESKPDTATSSFTTATPEPQKPPKKTSIPLPKPEEEKKKTKIVEDYPEGSVAYKMGIGWWVIVPPYGNKDKKFIVGDDPPKGVIIAKDLKSAYETIISFGGLPPNKTIRIEHGVTRAIIKSPSTKAGGGGIQFQRTALASKRKGQIFYTELPSKGGIGLSRHKLK